jgi:hypothetical protein
MSRVDVLLAIAVTVSMFVGWWRGRRSVGLESVGAILDQASGTTTWVMSPGRTRLEIEYRSGPKIMQTTLTFDEEEFAEAVRLWTDMQAKRRTRPEPQEARRA